MVRATMPALYHSINNLILKSRASLGQIECYHDRSGSALKVQGPYRPLRLAVRPEVLEG